MYRPIATVIAAAWMMAAGGKAVAADKTPPPAVLKVLLENEKVQVVEAQFKPGAVNKMQDRLPRVVYYVTDAHFKVSSPDGKTVERHLKAGSVAWRPQDTTEVVNAGKKDVRLIITYLK
jgi:beta-alanine degradation protein BauB